MIRAIILFSIITLTACGSQDDDVALTCTGLMLTEGNPHTLTMQVDGVPVGAALVLYQQERAYDTVVNAGTVSTQVDDCMLTPDRLVVMQGDQVVDECRTGWDTTQVTRANGAAGICYLNRIIDAP